MIAFEVKDMTCGHCVGTIRQAIQAADPQAQVSIDLARHQVTVEPAQAGADTLQAAIAEAGYTPVRVETAPEASTPPGRSCCGGCH